MLKKLYLVHGLEVVPLDFDVVRGGVLKFENCIFRKRLRLLTMFKRQSNVY